MKKIIIIAQARLTSKRFPGKVLKKIKNKSLIEILHLRLSKSKFIDQFIFAIPNNNENLKLKNFLKKKKFNFDQGPEKNVLKRFFLISKKIEPDIIIRVTCDCPLVDRLILEKMIKKFIRLSNVEYMSNTTITKNKYPDGMDIEIFSYNALKKAYKKSSTSYEKEHVTPYIQKNLQTYAFESNINYSKKRCTVDTPKDLENIKKLLLKFKYDFTVGYNKIIKNL